MLSCIASNSTISLIKKVCNELNITTLNEIVEKIDFLKYIKQTKVNFNVIKYLILDIDNLKNTEDEIINSIKYFKTIYSKTIIIIIAKGYDNQNVILTNLYENGIYNIINSNEEQIIEKELKKCLLEGLQKNNSKRFKKIEQVKNKSKQSDIKAHQSVYFFAIIVDAIKSLIKLVFYTIIFLLTSIGLTFLFNNELRNMMFEIFKNQL